MEDPSAIYLTAGQFGVRGDGVADDTDAIQAALFANEGGEGVTTDVDGIVYIVAGQVRVHAPSGQLIDTIEVPERPLQSAFGGKDGRTLFILGRTSLYALRALEVGSRTDRQLSSTHSGVGRHGRPTSFPRFTFP